MSVLPAACLIGWPAAHLRSPLIHKYRLKTFASKATIASRRSLRRSPIYPRSCIRARLQGANVTIPHKEKALALSIPDAARARGGGRGQYAVSGGTANCI